MANDTTNINIRMDKELKEQAEILFNELGMNMTTAFNIFLRQSVREGRIPFEVSLKTPNADTKAAISEAAEMKAGRLTKNKQSVDSFLEEMGV